MLKTIAAATLPLLITSPCFAQTESPCAPYAVVSAALSEKYHEVPVARMLSDRGFVIEVLAAADGTTVTVLGVQASGTACVLATGSAFSLVNAAVTPTPGSSS